MNCHDARLALLDADPAELHGESASALTHHLSQCGDCRVLSETLLAAQRGAARWMAERTPRRRLAALPSRRAATAGQRPRRRWPVLVAAAAAIAALIVTWPGDGPPAPTRGLGAPPPTISRIAVEAPAGRDVAVFETRDPDIVIIWFFPGETP